MRVVKVKKYLGRRRASGMRIFVGPENETVMEQFLVGRHTRPYNEYRKLLPAILEAAGYESELAQGVKWSSRAGCSCPCSPGFIMQFSSPWNLSVSVSTGAVEPEELEELEELDPELEPLRVAFQATA